LVTFGFGTKYTRVFELKPKLITVSPTETKTRPKVALLSDSVLKLKLKSGRPLLQVVISYHLLIVFSTSTILRFCSTQLLLIVYYVVASDNLTV